MTEQHQMVNIFIYLKHQHSSPKKNKKKNWGNKIFTFKGIQLFTHDQQIIMNISRMQASSSVNIAETLSQALGPNLLLSPGVFLWSCHQNRCLLGFSHVSLWVQRLLCVCVCVCGYVWLDVSVRC